MRWTRRIILLALGIVLGVAALVFASHNRQSVEIDFYFGAPVTVPLWLLTGACLLVGASVTLLLGIGAWVGRRRERARLRRRVAQLEREVLELRNIPLDTLEPDQPPPVERAVVASSGRQPRQVFASPPSPALPPEPRRALLTSNNSSADDDDEDDERRLHR